MATYTLNVNGQRRDVKVDPSTPLLWVLREELKMTGTKYGCGISVCGACTVHLGGVATRSCVVPISLVGHRPIVTIEGIGSNPVGSPIKSFGPMIWPGPWWTSSSALGKNRKALFLRTVTSELSLGLFIAKSNDREAHHRADQHHWLFAGSTRRYVSRL